MLPGLPCPPFHTYAHLPTVTYGFVSKTFGEKTMTTYSSSQEAAAASALHLHKLTLWPLDQRRNWRRYATIHERLNDNFRSNELTCFKMLPPEETTTPTRRWPPPRYVRVNTAVPIIHALTFTRTLLFTSTSPAPPRKASNRLCRRSKR
jgi:hypothetical protein